MKLQHYTNTRIPQPWVYYPAIRLAYPWAVTAKTFLILYVAVAHRVTRNVSYSLTLIELI